MRNRDAAEEEGEVRKSKGTSKGRRKKRREVERRRKEDRQEREWRRREGIRKEGSGVGMPKKEGMEADATHNVPF